MSKKKPRNFSLVIGSGGYKPWAALPLIRFLDEHQLTPELMVGCSGGSHICCTRSLGMNYHDIKKHAYEFMHSATQNNFFFDVDIPALLAIPNYPLGHFTKASAILKKRHLLAYEHTVFGNATFDDFQIPTVLLATDLETGEPVIMTQGSVARAVYATSALYPMLPPIYIDGKWLVDGGYHAPVPIMEAVKRSSDVIIVLMFEQPEEQRLTSFLDFFFGFISRAMMLNVRKQIPLALSLHHGEILFIPYRFATDHRIRDVSSIPEIFDFGEVILDQYADQILKMIYAE